MASDHQTNNLETAKFRGLELDVGGRVGQNCLTPCLPYYACTILEIWHEVVKSTVLIFLKRILKNRISRHFVLMSAKTSIFRHFYRPHGIIRER